MLAALTPCGRFSCHAVQLVICSLTHSIANHLGPDGSHDMHSLGWAATADLTRCTVPLCRKPPLSVKELVLCASQIAAGLGHLHSNAIVDQDIHPGNILCSLDGKTWKKADLGSADRNSINGKGNVLAAKKCQ